MRVCRCASIAKFLCSAICIWCVSVTCIYGQSSQHLDKATGAPTAETMLKQAFAVRKTDKKLSQHLANQVVTLAEQQKKLTLLARAHSLLGSLYAKSTNKNPLTHEHYQQAIDLYEQQGLNKQLIVETLDYAKVLISHQDYNSGYSLIDGIIPVAISLNNPIEMARIYVVKARAEYDQKHYRESESLYREALSFLNDKTTPTALKLTGSSYHQLGQIAKQTKKLKDAIKYHTIALDVHTKLGESALIAKSLKNLAIMEFKTKDYVSSLRHVFKGLELHQQLNNPSDKAELLMLAGMNYRLLFMFETSLEVIKEAQKIYKSIGNIGKVADSQNQIGFLYIRLQQYDQARTFYEKTLSLPRNGVAPKVIASSFRELAIIELNDQNYRKGLEFAEQADTIYQTLDDPDKRSITMRIIGDLHYGLGDAQSSVDSLQKALLFALETNNKVNQLKILNSLGKAYQDIDKDIAEQQYNKALEIGLQVSADMDKAITYQALLDIKEQKGQFDSALQYAKKLILVNQDIYRTQEENRIAFAKAKLDSHSLENEIASLRKRAKLDKLTLEHKNNEIELVQKSHLIAQLKLDINRYANFLLATLLFISFIAVVYTYRRFSTSRKHNQELDYLATHDPLTYCLNRRGLFDFISENLSNNKIENYSVIMADIDHFKQINDKFGHDIGDKVLVNVVEKIKDCLPKTDIIARYGGEEFCIVLLETTLEQAGDIAEKMRKNIASSKDTNISVTCSFGVATIDKFDETASRLISKADKALYKSKSTGRNKVTYYSQELTATEYK